MMQETYTKKRPTGRPKARWKYDVEKDEGWDLLSGDKYRRIGTDGGELLGRR